MWKLVSAREQDDDGLTALRCMAASGVCEEFVDLLYLGGLPDYAPWLTMTFLPEEADFVLQRRKDTRDTPKHVSRSIDSCGGEVRLSEVVAAMCVDVADVASKTVIHQTTVMISAHVAEYVDHTARLVSLFSDRDIQEMNPRLRQLRSKRHPSPLPPSSLAPEVEAVATLVRNAYLIRWPSHAAAKR